MRISAPPFTNPCYYGTDVDSREHLIACNHTMEEIRSMIGVDSLGYISLENVRRIGGNGEGYCTACFDGEYPTAVPKTSYKNRYETKISEKSKHD